VFVLLTLTACKDDCKPKIEYIDREVIVNVPVKCRVPKIKCNFNRETDTEVVASLLECITDLKRNSEVCK